jgi:hypothetical protein
MARPLYALRFVLRPRSGIGTFDLVVWSGRHVPAVLPSGKAWRDLTKGDEIEVVGRKAVVLSVHVAACEPVWGSSNGREIESGRAFEAEPYVDVDSG